MDKDPGKVIFKLNRLLPPDIVILGIHKVPDLSNARFAALRRTYRYIISTRKDPFLNTRALFIHDEPDLRAMNQAASRLKKHHDFAAFCRTGGGQKTTLCKIHEAGWKKEGHLYLFQVTADRFLRNMVRALVGTMLDVGRKKINVEEFDAVIRGKDRRKAGKSALACGLYLTRVEYPKSMGL